MMEKERNEKLLNEQDLTKVNGGKKTNGPGKRPTLHPDKGIYNTLEEEKDKV